MAIVACSFGKLLATIKSRGKNKCRTKADRGCGRRTVRMGMNGRESDLDSKWNVEGVVWLISLT